MAGDALLESDQRLESQRLEIRPAVFSSSFSPLTYNVCFEGLNRGGRNDIEGNMSALAAQNINDISYAQTRQNTSKTAIMSRVDVWILWTDQHTVT